MKSCIFARSSLAVGVCLSFFLSGTASASVDLLFHEDFNGYTVFPDEFPNNDPINFGVPLTSEGADNDWYGARFELPDNPIHPNPIQDILLDIGVQKIPGGGRPSPDPVGRAGDDAGLLFKLDTTGYENVQLTFDWRMFSAGSADKLVVGYTTLDLDPFFGPERVADFLNEPAIGNGSQSTVVAWWADHWTQLLRDNNGNYWTQSTFALPDNTPEIWVAFWIDNGDADFTKIDNINVTGTLIPEPASLVLFVAGCAVIRGRKLAR
ncbi:MAG: hypothetical protein D6698_03170 [Gammaproteobacteria bacterium]|nr:MAG: hypothetical protein D6698_03170 [Gammaproteobacteria bacterium]